jgi:hypothetical protein
MQEDLKFESCVENCCDLLYCEMKSRFDNPHIQGTQKLLCLQAVCNQLQSGH